MSRSVQIFLKSYRISYPTGGIFSSKMATSRLWPNSAPSFNWELRELIRCVKIVGSNENSCPSPKLEPVVAEMNCLGTHPALNVLFEIPEISMGIPLWKVSGMWHPGHCSLRDLNDFKDFYDFSCPTRQGRWSEPRGVVLGWMCSWCRKARWELRKLSELLVNELLTLHCQIVSSR